MSHDEDDKLYEHCAPLELYTYTLLYSVLCVYAHT